MGQSYGTQSRSGAVLLCRESELTPNRNHRTPCAPAVGEEQATKEVDLGIERIFSYAAWADKFDGAVHNPPFRNIAIAMNEPIGTVGVICPSEAPLLGFLSLVMPLLAVGNTVVAVPSENISADHRRSLSTLRHERPARWSGQHRNGLRLAAAEDDCRARRHRRDLVLWR